MFIRGTVYQNLSEFTAVYIRHDKNILAHFFLGHDVGHYLTISSAIAERPRCRVN